MKWVAQESIPVALTTREIVESDPELQRVRECLLSGRWYGIEFKEHLWKSYLTGLFVDVWD